MVPPGDFLQVSPSLILDVISTAPTGAHPPLLVRGVAQLVTRLLQVLWNVKEKSCQLKEENANGESLLCFSTDIATISHVQNLKKMEAPLFQTTCKFRIPHIVFIVGAEYAVYQYPFSYWILDKSSV